MRVATDCSGDGIGIVLVSRDVEWADVKSGRAGAYAAAWSLPAGWSEVLGLNIGTGEAWAVELGVASAISDGAQDVVVEVDCDNEGVTLGWRRGRSRNTATNNAFVRLSAVLAMSGCMLRIVRINTKANPADEFFARSLPEQLLALAVRDQGLVP